MVSRLARHALAALGSLVTLALMPSLGSSQGVSERFRAAERERVAEEMAAAHAEEGPRSPALIELYTALGAQYENDGQHGLATAALEQARSLVRANYGLHTLDQLPLMQQALENQQAFGDVAMVQAIEEEMLALAMRHPTDLRTVAVYRDAGRRRMDILMRLLAGDAPPEIYPEVGIYSISKSEVVKGLVTAAQTHYAAAAAVIVRNELYSSGELREIETEIVRASDLFRQRTILSQNHDPDGVVRNSLLEAETDRLLDLAGFTVFSDDVERRARLDGVTSRYEIGRDSYRRLTAYDEKAYGTAVPATQLQSRLEAHLQLADWDLLYSRNGLALEQYARVLAQIETTVVAAPLIAEIFAPPVPVVLPTFLANPLQTPSSVRYIDVAFEITRFGEGRRREILAAAPNVSDADKNELLALIKGSRFRPRVTDGELARAAPVVLRYYLND
jgi:hypothetical protein